ncbi:MAG TPA: carboxypeptidase-like regulatory domain-containing protein [Pyrinomonadaceae bacterium]|nr:carboxypeptidase-like regulatory domain-containing protein [Pyrinomonadaceae bacterium]
MKIFISLVLFLVFSTYIEAQQKETTAKNKEKLIILSGIVYDISGAVVANTIVTVKTAENRNIQTKTNEEGKFELKLLPAIYEIEFDSPGFKKLKLLNFRVVNSYSGKINHDVVLEVGNCNDCELMIEESIKENKKPKPVEESAIFDPVIICPRFC